MNRLSLQEMRNLLIKKGRLLYGAVFLFCLVCLYGLYTSQWTKVSDLAESREVDRGHSGAMNSDDKNGRGGAIAGNSYRTLADGKKTLTDDGRKGNTKSGDNEVLAPPVMSLTAVLRGHPLDNPFTHPLLNADMTAAGESATNRIVGTTNTADRRNTSGGSGNAPYGSTSISSGYSDNTGRSFGRRSHNSIYVGSGGGDAAVPKSGDDIKVTGIITGSSPMVILSSTGGEGCYGIGEGPSGVTVQQITAGAVLISDSGGTRWLYVD